MSCTGNVKTGLACAGGVIEGGIYEIGALCALEEAIEGLSFNAMDIYVGVSSGALVASCLANGISTRTLSRAIISRANDRLNITPEVLFTPAVREYGRRLGMSPAALFKSVRKYLRAPLDLSPMGAMVELGTLVPVGFFDNEPIQEYVQGIFTSEGRTNDFRELETCLRVVAMNLDTADATAFGSEDYAHVPISKAVQASTALPGLYCPVEIDGNHYIDGVARRTLNASIALEAGAELLFCINPIVPINTLVRDRFDHHISTRGTGRLVEHGLPAILSQTFRSVVQSRMRAGFRDYALRYPEADIVLIEPDFEDQSMFFSNIFSFSNRHAVCEQAYGMTRAYLAAHAGRLRPMLQKHGYALREDVLTDDSRRLFGPAEGAAQAAGGDGSDFYRDAHHVLDRLDRALDRVAADVGG